MATATLKSRRSRVWTEEEYLDLPGGRLVEFDHGRIEVLPMPDEVHQCVVSNLYDSLKAFVRPRRLGRVLFAPLPVKVANQKFREPDVVFLHVKDRKTAPEASKFWEDVSLVIEVLSQGTKNRQRDPVQKRTEYAAAGIAEYWLVDPKRKEVTVLKLQNGEYVESSPHRVGDTVRSAILAPYSISVEKIFEIEE